MWQIVCVDHKIKTSLKEKKLTIKESFFYGNRYRLSVNINMIRRQPFIIIIFSSFCLIQERIDDYSYRFYPSIERLSKTCSTKYRKANLEMSSWLSNHDRPRFVNPESSSLINLP